MFLLLCGRERSGSVVECLTRDRRVGGKSLTGCTVLCPRARHIIPCLVLVQPKKTCPNMPEKMLTGMLRIKSNKVCSGCYCFVSPLCDLSGVGLESGIVVFSGHAQLHLILG